MSGRSPGRSGHEPEGLRAAHSSAPRGDFPRKSNTILVSCGEASGDLLAAGVVRELKAKDPQLRVVGLGGPRCQEAGMELLWNISRLSVMGIGEVLPKLWDIFRLMREMEERAGELNPVAALLVDAPDFNLRLAKRLKSRGVRVVQYVSPSVWLWRSGRVKQLARDVDELCCILPFEEPWLRERQVSAHFVGHPLLDSEPEAGRVDELRKQLLAPPSPSAEDPVPAALSSGRALSPATELSSPADRPPTTDLSLAKERSQTAERSPTVELSPTTGPSSIIGPSLLDTRSPSAPLETLTQDLSSKTRAHPPSLNPRPILALLPGSRRFEVRQLLPVFAKTARLLAKELPELEVILPLAPNVDQGWVESICEGAGFMPRIIPGQARELLEVADAALVASGTATLEATLAETPMVVAYRSSWLTELVFRLFVRARFVSLPNILAGQEIVPERLQREVRAETLAQLLEPLLRDSPQRAAMKADLHQVRASLGTPGAGARVAQVVVGEGGNLRAEARAPALEAGLGEDAEKAGRD